MAQKIECEQRMRELLESSGMPQPDGVEYGYGCVRFFFDESKACVVVDIDNPEEEADGDQGDLELADQADDGDDDDDFGYLEAFGDPFSDTNSWN